MTRRVYIHVGPFKTGSTYLQQSMFERRDMLRERGIIVRRLAALTAGVS